MIKSRRDKSDIWTKEAEKRGYPARSIFKLEEINKRFSVLKSAKKILDVGAAPGSWTLFISKEILKGSGLVVAADLNPLSLSPMPTNVKEVIGDAFSPESTTIIKAEGLFDAVVSDAAPHTSGNRTVDVSRSEWLVESTITLCSDVLKENGNLVSKVFQGSGLHNILKDLRLKYNKVTTYKPSVCRSDSFECYIVALGKKN